MRVFPKRAAVFLVVAIFFLASGFRLLASADELPRIVGLTIEPTQVTLSSSDDSVQLLVTAKLSDGSFLDVTRAAQFSTDHDAVVAV